MQAIARGVFAVGLSVLVVAGASARADPGDQDELIAAVAAANRRTIVVLNAGGPLLMPWLRDVAAVLHVWYPGARFGAASRRCSSATPIPAAGGP